MPKKAPATKPSAAMRRRKPVTPAKASGAGWPVGMGALAKAQQEGAKVFENLRRQGQRLEQKTREAAADTAARAREMQQLAGGTLDKLEQVFEERVERALSKLGIYTQNDIQKLATRVDELSEAVNKLLHAQGFAPAPRKAARPAKAAAKAPAKPAAKAAVKPRAKPAAKAAAKRAA